jgi:hypothetical protein
MGEFHEDLFSHSEVDMGGIHRHRQHGDHISLLLYFQNKYSEVVQILKPQFLQPFQTLKQNIQFRFVYRFFLNLESKGRLKQRSFEGVNFAMFFYVFSCARKSGRYVATAESGIGPSRAGNLPPALRCRREQWKV